MEQEKDTKTKTASDQEFIDAFSRNIHTLNGMLVDLYIDDESAGYSDPPPPSPVSEKADDSESAASAVKSAWDKETCQIYKDMEEYSGLLIQARNWRQEHPEMATWFSYVAELESAPIRKRHGS